MLTYNLEFQDMESFIALHNYKSFTKASEKLYITQSALSRQYPKVQISYESVQDIDTRRYLLENSVDVVLSYLNAVENLPELDYTVIGENELLVSVGGNHPYFHRSSLIWEELRGQKLVDTFKNDTGDDL